MDSKTQATMIRIAKTNLQRDGSLMPVCFMEMSSKVKGKTNLSIIGLDFTNAICKNACFRMIKKVVLEKGVKSLLIITDAWRTIKDKGTIENGKFVMPSMDPEREECLCAEYGDKDGSTWTMIPYKKLESGIQFDKPTTMNYKIGDKDLSGNIPDIMEAFK